jgi:GT2 family glycosyltransferase
VTAFEAASFAVAPTLAIVIPVRNGARELRLCLEGLFRAGAVPDAIVVVDDASTDDTAAVAASLGVHVVRRMRCGGPAAARNAGVRHANADLILFVDADVIVASDTLARVRQAFRREPDIAAVFGSYDHSPAAPGIVSRYRNLLHHFVHQAANPEASTFWAGCGAIRRTALVQAGGFDEAERWNFIEDIELGHRLRRAGWRIHVDKGLQAKHLKRWTLASMVRTDLFYRARPWSHLLLQEPTLLDDLNVTKRQRVAVALSGFGCAALILAPLAPVPAFPAAVAALATVVPLNAGLFRFLRRRGGARFAALCFPLHVLHHLCGGVGFAWAWTERRLGAPRFAGRHARSPAGRSQP